LYTALQQYTGLCSIITLYGFGVDEVENALWWKHGEWCNNVIIKYNILIYICIERERERDRCVERQGMSHNDAQQQVASDAAAGGEAEIYAYGRIDFNGSLGGALQRIRNRPISIGRVCESTGLRARDRSSWIFDLSTATCAQNGHARIYKNVYTTTLFWCMYAFCQNKKKINVYLNYYDRKSGIKWKKQCHPNFALYKTAGRNYFVSCQFYNAKFKNSRFVSKYHQLLFSLHLLYIYII